MSGWEDFEGEAKDRARKRADFCAVRLFLNKLDNEAADHVRKAMANEGVSHKGIERALTDRVGSEGTPSAWSIGRHRRKDCSCEASDYS